jgi:CheY-like chemotaxis protein
MNKILLIDDDFNSRRVLSHHLSGMGCQVDEAEGVEGVERCGIKSYALIIVVVNVPVLRPCLTVLERIRHLNPRTPAVVISSFSTAEDGKRFIESGANDFLEKPYEATLLRDTIQRWISAASSR